MRDPFWFWKTNIYNKTIFVTLILVGGFALDFYFKVDLAKKTELLKQEFLSVCTADKHCESGVNTNFQECFHNNFDEDEVGLYQGFDEHGFSECMNKNVGVTYFKPIRLSEI